MARVERARVTQLLREAARVREEAQRLREIAEAERRDLELLRREAARDRVQQER